MSVNKELFYSESMSFVSDVYTKHGMSIIRVRNQKTFVCIARNACLYLYGIVSVSLTRTVILPLTFVYISEM